MYKRQAGFRADIDALPIEEKNEIDFKSVNTGVMHACGHDMHASVAAGLAVILWKFRQLLRVNILIVFQPAEECNPTGGAKAVIGQGLFEQFGVEEFYGLHMCCLLYTSNSPFPLQFTTVHQHHKKITALVAIIASDR